MLGNPLSTSVPTQSTWFTRVDCFIVACIRIGKEKFQAFDSQPIRELLLQLEWMSIAEPALLRVLHSQVRKMIHSTCGEDYMEKYLDKVDEWACSELLPWLDELLQTVKHSSTQTWRAILSQHVLQVRLATARTRLQTVLNNLLSCTSLSTHNRSLEHFGSRSSSRSSRNTQTGMSDR